MDVATTRNYVRLSYALLTIGMAPYAMVAAAQAPPCITENDEMSLLQLNRTTVAHMHNAPRKPVIWMHIHKSAGTTMCSMAQANHEVLEATVSVAGRADIGFVNCNWIPFDNYRFSSQTPSCSQREQHARSDGITWSAIERAFKAEDYCPETFIYAIGVRDPLKLAESIINFKDEGNSIYGGDKYKEILGCLVNGTNACPGLRQPATTLYRHEWMYFDNVLVRLLGGPQVMRLPPGRVNMEHVRMASDTLAKFEVKIRVEDIEKEDTAQMFRSKFGWRNLEVPHVLRDTSKTVRLSDGEMAQVRELVKYDYALYNQVK